MSKIAVPGCSESRFEAGAVALGAGQLAAALLPVVGLLVALSRALALGLAQPMLVGVGRACVQLGVLGTVRCGL